MYEKTNGASPAISGTGLMQMEPNGRKKGWFLYDKKLLLSG